LWGQAVEAYPEDAWAAAAMLVYRGQHQEPWADAGRTSLWFQTLGGDAYLMKKVFAGRTSSPIS
jgi:hypothetical protein